MSSVREVFLVGGARTAVGRYGGALARIRPDDLAALVVGAAVQRAGIDPDAIDEVVLGAANQAGEDNRNVARMAVLLAGLPMSVAGHTVNRLCASGLQAVAAAGTSIRAGEADIVVAGGVESMTRAPWVLAKPGTPWSKPGELADTALGWRFTNSRMVPLDDGEATLSLGACTEKLAAQFGITREECDEFAARSQQAAEAAWSRGDLESDIVSVPTGPETTFDRDETLRPGTTPEGLSKLRPVFATDGVVTAGNASPLSDGASAVVVASEAAVERYGLTPRARIVAHTAVGVAPSLFGLGPVPAIRRLLDRTSASVSGIDAYEINEAFAAQVLACRHELGLDLETLNAWGGAIALGHPLGSSGCRILLTLLARLEANAGRRGVASLCIGVGQGSAMLVERV